MLELIEAVSGRLIGSKSWNRSAKILKPIWTVCDCVGAVLGVCFINYAINCIVACIRPEMTMDFGFTMWNRCLMIGHEQ